MFAKMHATLDGSWCWDNTPPVKDRQPGPFGSFRHEGSFPDSLFMQSYSDDSVGSRYNHQIAAPANSPVSDVTHHMSALDNSLVSDVTHQMSALYTSPVSESSHNDSTHIYINLLDRSDLGMVKSTRFWDDSASSSSGYGHLSTSDSTQSSDTSESSGVESLIPDECLLDQSFDSLDITLCSRPSYEIQKPSMIRTEALRDASRGVHSKVGSWLQSLESQCAISLSRNNQQHYLPAIHEDSSSSPSELNSTLSLSDLKAQSSTHHSKVPSQRPSVTSRRPSISSQRPKPRHHENSIDSDATFFMQNPIAATGITGTKVSPSRQRAIVKKLKQVGKLLHHKKRSSSKASLHTLAVL